ncbi:hypothetical protein GCM10022403_065610 [Streptomyces coacervatus]|uniref:Uncharacterized protein n=1 Tax=Streptomyces coacervatus TaxID=647381 RepID=A0ABP7INV3_9ACTN
MAAPPPKLPQSAVIVADCGVTARALGANASDTAARAPAATAAPVLVRLALMGIRLPSRSWELPCGDGWEWMGEVRTGRRRAWCGTRVVGGVNLTDRRNYRFH